MNDLVRDLGGAASAVDDGTAAAPVGGREVDHQHPWLGLASFTEATREYFYGRDEEVAELARRVQRKLLTILFGQSGLGKTSILRAGLVPRLRPEGYCPVYVRIDYAPDSPAPSEQIKRAIFRETQASGRWTQSGVAVEGESLWEFLHHRDDVLKDAEGRTLTPLLIFDQFEEVFTIAQGDAFGRARAYQFLGDLADLVENRPPKSVEARLEHDDTAIERFDFTRADYRVLIALREDYLAHLEGLKPMMPSITQNRMRLARMTGAQALEAVTRPGGRLVSPEVAEAIVRFVAGGAELRNAEVEPALLSLVCRELNSARLAQGKPEISADVLAGSRDTILTEFYERALDDQPEAVRRVIEEHLLTDSGYRESLAEERLLRLFGEAGAAPDAMTKLVDRRLLRIEERLDLRRVELTHDVLTGVVKASRDVRLEREAREEAERKLGAQRERERATRRALIRARQIAAGCAVLAVLAVGSAIYGYYSTRRAHEAEAKAEQTRVLAEQARSEAEKLVVYLLDDFQLELAPVGRLDILAGLAKRALSYYNGLPEALRSHETQRNRALALVRYGGVLRTQGNLDESRKAIDEAVAVLSRLRDEGDRTETTTIGLALGRSIQGRIASSLDIEDQALASSQRAVDVLRPLADAPNASVAVRRAYGEVLNLHGFLEMRNDRDESAVRTLEAARAAYAGIDGGRLEDLAAAAGYAEASAWLVESSKNLGRGEEAAKAAKDALDTAGRVLERRPGHLQALRAQALAASPMSGFLLDNARLAEALAYNDAAIRGWRESVRYDPGNAISWSNLCVGLFLRGFILSSMGQLSEAAAAHREVLEIQKRAPRSTILDANAANNAGRLGMLEAMLAKPREAEAALELNAKLRNGVAGEFPPGSFTRELSLLQNEWWRYGAREQGGDFRGALALGKAVLPKLEVLKPSPSELRFYLTEVSGSLQMFALLALMQGEDREALDAVQRGLAMRSRVPVVSVMDRREVAALESTYALALARAGRIDDARAAAGSALKTHRALAATGHDSATLRLDQALALYAAAATGVEPRAKLLAEAQTLLDKLPPELRRAPYPAYWRERIATERLVVR